jgi:hypothetical protein
MSARLETLECTLCDGIAARCDGEGYFYDGDAAECEDRGASGTVYADEGDVRVVMTVCGHGVSTLSPCAGCGDAP